MWTRKEGIFVMYVSLSPVLGSKNHYVNGQQLKNPWDTTLVFWEETGNSCLGHCMVLFDKGLANLLGGVFNMMIWQGKVLKEQKCAKESSRLSGFSQRERIVDFSESRAVSDPISVTYNCRVYRKIYTYWRECLNRKINFNFEKKYNFEC